jgi:hypothetical protein
LSFLIVANPSFAQDVQYLSKDQKAPFEGFLFTAPKASELKDAVIERDNYKLINLSLEKSLELEKKNSELQNQKVNVVLEQNLNLTKSLNEERSMSNWERILWFVLGVVGTGMAVYGASKIAK